MIITDTSVDVEGIKKIPLYVEWRGKKVEISKLKRNSYFLSVKNVIVDPPSFKEVKEMLFQAINEDGRVNVILPSWPVNFVERSVSLVAAMENKIHVEKVLTDNVTLSHLLKDEKNIESLKNFSSKSRTYILFSDVSFLKKNGIISSKSSRMILTRSFNLVKHIGGRTFLKQTWSANGAITSMMRDINEKHFTVDIRHSGKSRMANAIASSFLSKFKCKVAMGWMNPVAASLYGLGTVSVTVIPEV
ncbi:hypothetical protein [Mesoaciditoga sp.]